MEITRDLGLSIGYIYAVDWVDDYVDFIEFSSTAIISLVCLCSFFEMAWLVGVPRVNLTPLEDFCCSFSNPRIWLFDGQCLGSISVIKSIEVHNIRNDTNEYVEMSLSYLTNFLTSTLVIRIDSLMYVANSSSVVSR